MREAHAKGRLLDARMNGLTIFLIKNTERTVRRESKLNLAEKNISRDYFPVLLQHQRLVCLFKNIYIFVKFHLYTRLGIIEPCINADKYYYGVTILLAWNLYSNNFERRKKNNNNNWKILINFRLWRKICWKLNNFLTREIKNDGIFPRRLKILTILTIISTNWR